MKANMKGLSVTQLIDEGRLLRRAVTAARTLLASADTLGITPKKRKRRKVKKRKPARKAAAKSESKKVKTHLGKAKPEKPKKRAAEDEDE